MSGCERTPPSRQVATLKRARRSNQVVGPVVLAANPNKGHFDESAGCRRYGHRVFYFNAQYLSVDRAPRQEINFTGVVPKCPRPCRERLAHRTEN
jgi:hypothetical protein